MQNMSPCLWFNGQDAEAALFYVGIFKNSRILETTYYPEGMPGPAGSVMTVRFVLDGREFVGLNAGPDQPFTPAISFVAYCDSQEELDAIWARLIEGGSEVQCGWLTDRYGVSWQVVPRAFIALLSDPDRAAVQRAMSAMMSMKKLDLPTLQKAFESA
jgi:predicted 3-demethylubiquinone-9 3-methyltransferase (glyoxalase superfamily)